MIKKKLFSKKKPYIKIIYYLFFIVIVITIIFVYFLPTQGNFIFTIPSNSNSFYVIPADKEGKKITNQQKKILHLNYIDKKNIDLINDPNLNYSIQLYASDNYQFIKNFRSKLTENDDSIFLPEDLFVAILNYELTSEYLLLFKNFKTRKSAITYCEKYSYYLEKCIIVNVKNLD